MNKVTGNTPVESLNVKPVERRKFVKGALLAGAALGGGMLAACSAGTAESATQAQADSPQALPPASPDPDDQWGRDLNINIETIDEYLGREDVAYIDVRMLRDPADYEAIGGVAILDRVVRGFKVVPYPYLASLQPLPVEGAYEGPKAF